MHFWFKKEAESKQESRTYERKIQSTSSFSAFSSVRRCLDATLPCGGFWKVSGGSHKDLDEFSKKLKDPQTFSVISEASEGLSLMDFIDFL